MITSVIFQAENTLLDTVDLRAQAWQEIFREFGKGVPLDEIHKQLGTRGEQFLPVFWTNEELALAEEQIVERRRHLFKQKYLDRVEAFPEVRELCQRILRDGKEIALASSASAEELDIYKERAEIRDLLKGGPPRPNAKACKSALDIFEAALDQLGHPSPEETIVVGGTQYDIGTAAQSGLRVIALRCGGFSDEALRGALAIFDDPADLLARYDESPFTKP